MECAVCGATNEPGAAFCDRCGSALRPAAPATGQTVDLSRLPTPPAVPPLPPSPAEPPPPVQAASPLPPAFVPEPPPELPSIARSYTVPTRQPYVVQSALPGVR